jgi:hypothetical protein
VGTVAWRSKSLYEQRSRWSGSVYRVDPDYGYFPKQSVLAYHSLKHGERVPVIFEWDGFRVPHGGDKKKHSATDLRILFLGGSFTHGYGIPAERTFAYLTGDALGAVAMNAGGSGWGLSQMVMRARDVIPRLKPDIVVVEYSNTLARRSMNIYGPTNWAKSPAPYFYESSGAIEIQRPVFQSVNFKLPIWDFPRTSFPSFVWHVGIPLYIHDDFLTALTYVKRELGILPAPIKSKQRVVDFAYNSIHRLCDIYGAAMFILVLPAHYSDRPHQRLDASAWIVVTTLESLRAMLPESSREVWAATYRFQRGDPPRTVDNHPNPRMHAAIADILVNSIQQFELNNSDPLEQKQRDAHIQLNRPNSLEFTIN